MSSWPPELLELLDDPLFDRVRPRAVRPSVQEQLLTSLQSTSAWVREMGRLPQSTGDLVEKQHHRSLASLRTCPERAQLEAWDELGILSAGDDFTLPPTTTPED